MQDTRGVDVINKFLSSVDMLGWNKALWLAAASHLTRFNQLKALFKLNIAILL